MFENVLPSLGLKAYAGGCPCQHDRSGEQNYRPPSEYTAHASTGCDRCTYISEFVAESPDKITTIKVDPSWSALSYFHGSSIESKSFTLFVAQGRPRLVPELPKRLSLAHGSAAESLARVKVWMARCAETHRSCCSSPGSTEPPLPKRIIEIGPGSVRLIEAGDRCGRYVALSHCWGDSRPRCLTTRASIAANLREIPWGSLPLTFQDAVLVCRELGFRYLWIDSMCIIQDDESDWREQSGKMAEVYSNSNLTVCATNARSDDCGLWNLATSLAPKKIVVRKLFRDFEVHHWLNADLEAVHLRGSDRVNQRPKPEAVNPLMGRGWTFQERLMSSRLLHFGHGELFWQCRELHECECGFGVKREQWSIYHQIEIERDCEIYEAISTIARPHRVSPAEAWRGIAARYSALDLTFQKDMLPALSGIAKKALLVRPDDRYLAGLWESGLIDELAWHVCYGLPIKPRPPIFRAPSWSWASVTQTVMFSYNIADSRRKDSHARIVRAGTTLAGPDPTGEVLSGYVVMVAPVEWAQIVKVPQVSSKAFSVGKDADATVSCYADSTTEMGNGTISLGEIVFCLALKKTEDERRFVLVLVAVLGSPGVYRRIGWFEGFFPDGWFNEELEVEII